MSLIRMKYERLGKNPAFIYEQNNNFEIDRDIYFTYYIDN